MQSYITNNFHGISHKRSTNYILPVRICEGRARDKSLCFQSLPIKHLHTHFVHVKNPNKKSSFPQSLLRSQINNSSVQGVMPSPARAAKSVHPGPTPLASSFNSLSQLWLRATQSYCLCDAVRNISLQWTRICFVFLEISFCFRSVKRGKLISQLCDYINQSGP